MPPDRYKVERVNQGGIKIDTLAEKILLFIPCEAAAATLKGTSRLTVE